MIVDVCVYVVCTCVCVLMLQTCVSDLNRVSVENTAARNDCADVSQQLSVLQSKSMLVDLQKALRVPLMLVSNCAPNVVCSKADMHTH